MTDAGAWTEQHCKRIENPPKPDNWRSRYGVFRDAADRIWLTPFTADEQAVMLNALSWCAWAEGVATKHVDDIYRRNYRRIAQVRDEATT